MKALRLAFWRKPLHLTASSQDSSSPTQLERSLGLFDLLMLGIGGTVGSGVFATAGLIASSYAGPAATLSWLLAAVGCLLSGLSFMELACRIPSTGSTYAYAYHALGELPAMIAGFLLTLEYGVSSAGGARSWSDKFTQWMETQLGVRGPEWMKPADSTVDVYAGLLMALNTMIVLCGMQAGKLVVNVITMTKITVVLFIIIVGLLHFDVNKMTPFVPEETLVQLNGQERMAFGWPGVLLGASASFYGYIGYDEVCCLAGEAKNPAKNIPRAVVGTIIGAATLSILATLALVGMQKYTEIDAEESYGNAFASIGLDWAASFVASGEVLTMPITSFIGFLAQPHLQYAMAKDGLLPAAFAEIDSNGTLFRGTFLCGIGVTALAVFVPFPVLWNFISLGILTAFNLTNCSLLLVRVSNHSANEDGKVEESSKASHGSLIAWYLVTSFLAAFHWQNGVISSPVPTTEKESILDRYMQTAGPFVAALFTVVAIAFMFALRNAEKEQIASSKDDAAKAKAKQQGPVEIILSSKKKDDKYTTKPLQRRSSGDQGDDETCNHENDSDKNDLKGKPTKLLSPLESVHGSVNGSTMGTESDDDKNDSTNSDQDENDTEAEESTFRAPLVPFAPCVAIFFNWFLFAQMDSVSVLLILLWLLFAMAVYFGYSRHHSLAFQQTQYHQLAQH